MRIIRHFLLAACASFTLSSAYAMDDNTIAFDFSQSNPHSKFSSPAATEDEWQYKKMSGFNFKDKHFSEGLEIVPPKKHGVIQLQIGKNLPQKYGACTGQVTDLGVYILLSRYHREIEAELRQKKISYESLFSGCTMYINDNSVAVEKFLNVIYPYVGIPDDVAVTMALWMGINDFRGLRNANTPALSKSTEELEKLDRFELMKYAQDLQGALLKMHLQKRDEE